MRHAAKEYKRPVWRPAYDRKPRQKDRYGIQVNMDLMELDQIEQPDAFGSSWILPRTDPAR